MLRDIFSRFKLEGVAGGDDGRQEIHLVSCKFDPESFCRDIVFGELKFGHDL